MGEAVPGADVVGLRGDDVDVDPLGAAVAGVWVDRGDCAGAEVPPGNGFDVATGLIVDPPGESVTGDSVTCNAGLRDNDDGSFGLCSGDDVISVGVSTGVGVDPCGDKVATGDMVSTVGVAAGAAAGPAVSFGEALGDVGPARPRSSVGAPVESSTSSEGVLAGGEDALPSSLKETLILKN